LAFMIAISHISVCGTHRAPDWSLLGRKARARTPTRRSKGRAVSRPHPYYGSRPREDTSDPECQKFGDGQLTRSAASAILGCVLRRCLRHLPVASEVKS
jgi:hypothetical protein